MVDAQQHQRTLAILVCYGQDFRESVSWLSLRAAAHDKLDWFIVDNSLNAVAHQESVMYTHLPHNPGVSEAYLRGAAYAKSKDYKQILLLDQDSIFPKDAWESYELAQQKWPGYALYSPQLWAGNKGISPAPNKLGRTFAASILIEGPYSLRSYSPINAGMLLQLDAYLAVGGHASSVYLDFSDFAFIRRFRQQFPMAVAVPLTVKHGLSGLEKSSKNQDLSRFKHYLNCARAYAQIGGPKFWLYFWAIIRALLLSFRYRSFAFFGLILKL